MKVPDEAFSSGLLDKDYHERLLADLTKVTQVAGIPAKYVWSKLSAYCGHDELAWVRSIRHVATDGLAYTGKLSIPVDNKMFAITGAMLRNYIDARVMTVQDVLQKLKDGDMPTPTVLLIPNFCIEKGEGGDIPQWQASSLLGLLYSRAAKEQKTVIYITSKVVLEKQYGSAIASHVEAHYQIL